MTSQPPIAATATAFPAASLSVDYPDRDLDRLSSALRVLWAIPILLVICALSNGSGPAAGVVFLPPLLMIVGRGRYPGWWFTWNVEMTRFSTRVAAYLLLMDDRYPSTEDEQSIHLELVDPGREPQLNRALPLVKWLLVVPHFIVLMFLFIGVAFAVIAAWFAILFTGRYPRGLFTYVEGVLRWNLRVTAYAFLLITDQYPPFRLSA